MTHPADLAADLIAQHIRAHRQPLTRILATLEPLEAIALLGEMVAVTIDRFQPDQRADMRDAFCAELRDDDA